VSVVQRTLSATALRMQSVRPTRADAVDAGFLVALSAVALLGLGTTYDGHSYLVVGLVGVLLGIVIAHVVTALHQPVVVVVALAVVVFFVLGGAVTLRGRALPTPGSVHDLADVSVHGWKDLLTTLPPVDGAGPLLVLPYAMGLLAGAAGFALARRVRAAVAAPLVPVVLLGAVIVLGTRAPGSRWVQGGVFAALLLAWVTVRSLRTRPVVQSGSSRATRAVTAVGLLVLAGVGAAVVGPLLPGAHPSDRTVLRSYVDPPFDIGAYPSPLAGYRSFTKGGTPSQVDDLLFTVTGPVDGQFVRIATLDSYDGTVWGAGDPLASSGSAGAFQRVGPRIASDITGSDLTLTVTVGKYALAWLPDVGVTTGVTFGGPNAAAQAASFRYNLGTDTGVVPGKLHEGDSYTLRSVVPAPPGGSPVAQPVVTGNLASFARTRATAWAGTAPDPMAQIAAIGTTLRTTGAYSDGATDAEVQYTPGHYVQHLADFLNAKQPVGDDEQYAAAYALLINSLGYGARVVMGAVPSATGEVHGGDVRAGVEVQMSTGGWLFLGPDTFTPDRQKKPDATTPPQDQSANAQVVPPPVTQRPPTSLTEADQTTPKSRNQSNRDPNQNAAAGSLLPAWLVTGVRWGGPPVLVVALVCSAVIGLKAQRRRRRRSRGPTATRFVMGWREVVDHARDLGTAVPGGLTRREQAGALAMHDVAFLAGAADAQVFGPGEPAEEGAAAFWVEVDRARKQMSRGAGRWRRVRAALSLGTVRRTVEPA
jgi:hypothetical protein